ncbi:MAG: recombinase family protein [Lachnospiraceae bacterium]|nr:recombinase family protein [Lachnospiraceae bacterium]
MARTSKKNQEIFDLAEKEGPIKVYSAGIYARLSVDSDERKNESIRTQIEIAKEFINGQKDMRIYDIYIDIGRTGTNFAREGFSRMMRDVRQREINCIVVKDLSRFGRNHIETGNYIEKIFPFMGVRFIAVADNFDSKVMVPNETLNVNLKNLVNEMYARDISRKVRSSRQTKWEQGSYIGGIPPYGYRAEWIGDKKRLLIEETTSEIVKKIFELFLSGSTMREIICWLYENRIERPAQYHKTGQIYGTEKEKFQQWTQGTVKMILTNPVYMGCLVQKPVNGKNDVICSRQEMDLGEWKIKEGTHEAIIPEDLFFQAAERFQKSSASHNKKRDFETIPMEENPFEDILFCGECGSKMKRISRVRESSTKGKIRIYSYHCPNSGRIDGFKCERKNITLTALKNIVAKAVCQETALSGLRLKKLQENNSQKGEWAKREWRKETAAIERNLAGIITLGSEQYRRYRMGEMEEEYFKYLKEKNEKKAAVLRRQKEVIEEKLRKTDEETMQKNHVLYSLIKGREESGLTKETVQALIHRIEVYPDYRVKIIFAFQRRD